MTPTVSRYALVSVRNGRHAQVLELSTDKEALEAEAERLNTRDSRYHVYYYVVEYPPTMTKP